MHQKKPTKEELTNAVGKTIQDIIAPKLRVLFCGINPGLYSGATGLHFARPGNRFWKSLFAGGFTPRLLQPYEQDELLKLEIGITNVVNYTTAAEADIPYEDFVSGGKWLEEKVLNFEPEWIAFVGIGAYRRAFNEPRAQLGRQERMIGNTKVWVLPSTSGLNANHSGEKLGELFKELHDAAFRAL
jgi:TDG/mug DNA glycosylase family protein